MGKSPNEMEIEYRKQRYEAYIDERERLRQGSIAISARYDKWILTLSAGALALSVTFIEKIAQNPDFWTLILLGLAWAGFILSIVFEMFALRTSQNVTNESLEYLQESYRDYLASLSEVNETELPISRNLTQDFIEKLKARTRFFNTISLWSFVVGIFFLCFFSLVNLPYNNN